MQPQSIKYQLIADLLSSLEAEGFRYGIGKHLELQQLISKLPEDIPPEELSTILCPIFANTLHKDLTLHLCGTSDATCGTFDVEHWMKIGRMSDKHWTK